MKSSLRFWLGSSLVLCLGLVLIAWGYSHWYLNTYTQVVADRILLLNELRKGALEQYFATAEAELSFWNTNANIVAAQEKFTELWHREDPLALAKQIRQSFLGDRNIPTGQHSIPDDAEGNSSYSTLHGQIHPIAKLFVSERGYYDMFLIGSEGDIYYTVEKEADFASNLKTGQWRNTHLASVYRRAMLKPDSVVISDMQAYAPSAGAPAIFMAKAIIASAGDIIGVIAFQLPTARILNIMNYTGGMRETGETYLVGQDRLMRSDSRFSDTSTVLQQRVDTTTANKALSGQHGIEFTQDYRGVEVLSAYSSFTLDKTSWAVMAEIDREEISAIAAGERPALSGILAFIFGLSLWSIWYWQGRPLAGESTELARFDLENSDFHDGPNLSG
ncbi:MAG: hypothetical protein DRR42_08600 [Gammaproteobacteria bacterium]|nr:MAG: hypothetical protein DRR42_08600 [Gammaproteobacteria bacterium]